MEKSTAEIQPERRQERLKFGAYGVSFIALGLALSALGPMLPFLADNLGVTIGKISFILTVSNLGYLIGSAGGGRLYDRFKGHRLMSLALVLMVVGAVLAPLVRNFYLLLLVFLVFGFGNGLLDIGGNVNLLWVFQSRVGPYMNALHFFFGVGAFLAPIILTNVMRLSGGALTWPFWTLAILFLPGLLGLSILPSPVNPEGGQEQETDQKPDTKLVILMMVLLRHPAGHRQRYGGLLHEFRILGRADPRPARGCAAFAQDQTGDDADRQLCPDDLLPGDALALADFSDDDLDRLCGAGIGPGCGFPDFAGAGRDPHEGHRRGDRAVLPRFQPGRDDFSDPFGADF